MQSKLAAAIALATFCSLWAQSAPAPLSFDVASVKQRRRMPAAPQFRVELPPPPDPNGPTLFTAIQEQLGLRLESQKGPIDMIVIDRIEKASEN